MQTKRPAGYYKLIDTSNAKTSKGIDFGYWTGVVYLAPADEAGRASICALSTKGCQKGCLYGAGRASFDPEVIAARIRRTHMFFDNRELFIQCLRYDIEATIRQAKREKLIPAIRVNGTSDLAWLALQMAAEYPTVQFYDYTKLNRAWERIRANYHLTFSHSESNQDECLRALEHGLNVAVVFDVKKGKELPSDFMGRPVLDGDKHDIRFLDGYQGAIIGLRAKGPAKRDTSGFVVKSTFVQITLAA